MPAEMNLAGIIAEVRRQNANFQTVILKTGHALRLVALAEAAVEMREGMVGPCADRGCQEPRCHRIRRFDALASPATGAGEEGE